MLMGVSFFWTECLLWIDEKIFLLCRITALELQLNESIKTLFRIIIVSAHYKSNNVIFPFSQNHWNDKWHTLLFTSPPVPQILYTYFTANIGSEWLILIPSFDSKVIVICLLLKVSEFCLTERTSLPQILREPVRIILTLEIHSYRNSNFKLKREINKSELSASLAFDTVY